MSVSTNRKFVILPSLQRVSGDPYGAAKRDLRPTFEVVEGGKVLLIRNLHGRCEQKLVAIWRPGLVRGTWKTLGDVLIQPETMRPAVVAKCDSLYTLAVRLPDDASTEPGALRVYERGDAYAEPGGRAPGFREIARALSGADASATGFSFGDKKWRYFQVYRLTGTGEPRLIAQRGPVLLTEYEVADEMFGWREAERRRGGILSINRWTYSPESGWRRT